MNHSVGKLVLNKNKQIIWFLVYQIISLTSYYISVLHVIYFLKLLL